MNRHVMVAVVAAMALPACVHLLQPQTWTTDTRTIDLQQTEYLMKELVRGLPEPVFARWYGPESAARDALRPTIRKRGTDGPFTVYEVGSDAGVAGQVAFRDAALDHWTRWRLMQESVVSSWIREDVTPRQVPPATLARIVGLDPVADPLRPQDREESLRACSLRSGDVVDTLVPLLFDRDHGNRLIRWFPSSRTDERGGPVSTLTAGTTLTIRRWDPVHGRRLEDGEGTFYLVDAALGIDTFADVFCPRGQCAPAGAQGVVARDLDIVSSGEAGETDLAVLPGRYRVPVWMQRTGMLREGAVVRVRRWAACTSMEAEIEPPSTSGEATPPALKVPVAPPGLFRPLATPAR